MQWNFRIQGSNPFCFRVHFFCAVIFARDNQRCHFHMTLRSGDGNRVFDRFQISADPVIVLLRKTFQVNIHRIGQRKKFPKRFFANHTVCDDNGFQTNLMGKFCTIIYILIPNQRLIVCECDT